MNIVIKLTHFYLYSRYTMIQFYRIGYDAHYLDHAHFLQGYLCCYQNHTKFEESKFISTPDVRYSNFYFELGMPRPLFDPY